MLRASRPPPRPYWHASAGRSEDTSSAAMKADDVPLTNRERKYVKVLDKPLIVHADAVLSMSTRQGGQG
jgi:hypothetical protein